MLQKRDETLHVRTGEASLMSVHCQCSFFECVACTIDNKDIVSLGCELHVSDLDELSAA